MPVLDFREIPEAHKGSGVQDTFEQFTAEFLELLGMRIVQRPSRGPDGGKDLTAIEIRKGKLGESSIQYLVSCKHKAFSGTAVSRGDEEDIDDRVKSNDCNGFLGVYSTIPSSGLTEKLRKLSFEHEIFDNRRIEKELLRTSEGVALAKRYFPNSIQQWLNENPSPILIYEELQCITCQICGRDLLSKVQPPRFLGGVLGFCVHARDEMAEDEPPIVDLCWYCKVTCMKEMEQQLKANDLVEDGWDDLFDYVHPSGFVTRLISNFDLIVRMNTEAKKKFGQFLGSAFQYVARELTSSEKEIRERMRESGMYF